MGVFVALLELQNIDTTIDQLQHRLAHLPETASVEAALASQRAIDSERRGVQGEADRLIGEISAGEGRTAEIRHHLDRLNRQMKTIIAPREAEALQHEIDTLKAEMSDIDDRCLVAMDDLAVAESRIAELGRALEVAEGKVGSARDAEAAAATEVRTSIEEQQRLREAAGAAVPAAMLSSYDTKRRQLSGVAVARLTGLSCGGCHLDISRSEADQLSKMPDDDRECPNCSRWLVL